MTDSSQSSAAAQPAARRSAMREGIHTFFQGSRTDPAASHDSDWEYRTRLLTVYRKLLADGHLVAPLPEWVNFPVNEEALRASPRLQAAVAACTDYNPSKWLLEKELALRTSTRSDAKSWSPESGEDVFEAAARDELNGLCFSGGGIRSATFCLGVLQGLAGSRKLEKFDYLSTVSGGGYIHEWLASWIMRDPKRMAGVAQKLVPIPGGASPARTPEPILWLRRYSSYLTPQRGIMSADTWTMIAIWFRNTFLNQIVLFSFLAACILAIRAVTFPFVAPTPQSANGQATNLLAATPMIGQWATGFCLLFLIASSIYFSSTRLWLALASVTAPVKPNQVHPDALDDSGVVVCIVLPSFVLCVLVALESIGRLSVLPIGRYPILLGGFFLYVVALLLAATFGGQAPAVLKTLSQRPRTGWFSLAMILSAVLCTALALAPAAWLANLPGGPDRFQNGPVRIRVLATQVVDRLDRVIHRTPPAAAPHVETPATGSGSPTQIPAGTADALIAVFLPVWLLALQFLALRMQLGMIGRSYTESRREWLARFGAWSAIFAGVWMLLSAIALIGPRILAIFVVPMTPTQIGGLLSVVAAHAVTLYSGGSGKSDGKPKPGSFFGYSALDLVGIVGAPICILSLLIIVSGLVDIALSRTASSAHPVANALLFSVGVVLVFLLFGWRVDVNEFSMHGFYRNRLARCYLGATDRSRTPDPFTHFDEHETGVRKGLAVSDLLPVKFGGKAAPGDQPYDGPFPIFCSTINLTFGEDLGWQDRKGASFSFTPLYSGYHVGWTAEKKPTEDTTFNGFVRTADYAYPGAGISLAMAAAISGAALSPNQGFSSTPSLAFLMTLFNVRLGWWLANPRKPRVWPSRQNSPTPAFGIGYLLKELFGHTDDTSGYVCLCDGGRFENMGIYELVRRRCKLIVICDAEKDSNMVFDGIGNAIARCRADFGAEIDLDLSPLIPAKETLLSSCHFRVGTIQYPAPPGRTAGHRFMGTVVYLKSTLVGDETGDILHHKLTCPDFPQDSTVNQWFTESQFESYRRLGQLIAERASGKI